MGPKKHTAASCAHHPHSAAAQRTRARTRARPPPPPPPPVESPPQVTTTHPLHRKEIVPTRFLDEDTLQAIGLHEEVMGLLRNIGWVAFAQLRRPTFATLTREFLSSFSCKLYPLSDQEQWPGEITFTILGTSYTITIHQFSAIFGFPVGQNLIPRDFPQNHVWAELTVMGTGTYEPKSSKASRLRSPAFRYIQKWLANTICARGESQGVLSRTELYFLHCMVHGIKVNGGYWLCTHLKHLGSTRAGRILLGGYITTIAEHFGVSIDALGEDPVKGLSALDGSVLIAMGLCVSHGGTLRLLGPGGDILPPSASGPHSPAPDDIPFPPEDFPSFDDAGGPSSSSHSLAEVLARIDCLELDHSTRFQRLEDHIQQFEDFTTHRLTAIDAKLDALLQRTFDPPPPS